MTRRSEDESLIEDFLDRIESSQSELLRKQVEQSERDFRNGDVISWDELKRRNKL